MAQIPLSVNVWIKRFFAVGFIIFLLKGLAWLVIVGAVVLWNL